jgi:vitamin B12 transporter
MAQTVPPRAVPIETVTATYVKTPLADIPASVTVITRAEIRRRGYVTLTQALSAVPGVQVVPSGGPGGQASLFIEGSNSEDVLVLRDGVPMNDPSVANGAFNFGESGLADIERIEVVRGPMSGLYGTGAIGGVINLISRRGFGAPHLDYDLEAGFPGQGKASATISGMSGKFDYALTASTIQEAGFDALARRLTVYDGNRNPFRYKMGALNLGYTITPGTRVSLILRARASDYTYPDLGFPAFNDPYENGFDSTVFARFGVSSRLFRGALATSLYVSHIQDDRRYLTLLAPADPNQFAEDSGYRGDRAIIQWNNVLHLPDAGPLRKTALIFGAEHRHDTAAQNLNESFFGFPYIATVNAAQNTTAFHLGGQTTALRRLTLTAAARDDSVTGFGHAVTWRAGGVYALPALNTRLKASYGTGFLAPSLYDLHGIDTGGYTGNPGLRPERSQGFQFGAETVLAGFGRPELLSIAAHYFKDDISQLIQYVQTTPFSASERNIGAAHIHGVETSFILAPAAWLSADLTYTYTIARDGGTHAPLLRRPENSGAAILRITPLPALTIEPQIRYIGRFTDYLTGNQGYPAGIGDAKPGTIADLTVSYRVSPALTLFATGRNLFNSRFEPVNGLQIPGQNFLFGLRGRLGL